MKLTKKSVKHEVETTETVCEITQSEFDQICAKMAADTVTDYIGCDGVDVDDLIAGLTLTALFAEFVSKLDDKLFTDKTENPDKNEKEEK